MSATTNPEVKLALKEWRTAERSLISLESAPNLNLKGRLSLEAEKRIRRFLRSDQLFKDLKLGLTNPRSDGDDVKSSKTRARERVKEFTAAVEHAIGVFEKLAKRNPSVDIPIDSRNLQVSYRLLALILFAERGGAEVPTKNRSIYGTEKIKKTTSPRAKPVVTPEPEEAPEPASQADPESELFEIMIGLLKGAHPSIRRQFELYSLIRGDTGFEYLESLKTEEKGFKPVAQELEILTSIVNEVASLDPERNLSMAQAVELGQRISHLNTHIGLETIESPIKEMVKENLISPVQARRIEDALDALMQSDPLTVQYMHFLDLEDSLSLLKFKGLDAAIRQLRAQGVDDKGIETFIEKCGVKNSGNVVHFQSCVELRSRGVDVTPILEPSPSAIQIAADAAQGGMDAMGPKGTGYGVELSARIRFELKLAIDQPLHIRAAIERISAELKPDMRYEKAEFKEALLTFAVSISVEEFESKFHGLAQDLAYLTKKGISAAKIAKMLERFPIGSSKEGVFDFVSNMASLVRTNVAGVAKLWGKAYSSWQVEHPNGTERSIGFLREAAVAVNLATNGYRVKGLCVDSRLDYEYDMVVEPLQGGKGRGVEVKSQFLTLLDFGNMDLLGTKEGGKRSQLIRFMGSSEADGLEPVIVVVNPKFDGTISESAVGMLRRLKEVFGKAPQVLSGINAQPLFIKDLA